MRISDWSSDVCSSDLAAALQAAVNALRFIDDDDGARRTDQVDGRFAARLLAILVEVVHVLLVDRAHGDDHDLNGRAGGKVPHLAELGGIVEEIVEGLAGIETFEMLFGDLESLVDALLRSEEHTSELKSLMRLSYAVLCWNTKQQLQ